MKPEEVTELLKETFPPRSPEHRARLLARIEARLAAQDAEEAARRSRARRRKMVGATLLLLAAALMVVAWMAVMARPGAQGPSLQRPSDAPNRASEDEGEEEPPRSP